MLTFDQLDAVKGALIDLTLPIRAGMFEVGGHENVTFRETMNYEPDRFTTTAFSMSAHTGTHMDYPAHLKPSGPRMFPDGSPTDTFFPEFTLSPAWVLDFSGQGSDEVIALQEVRSQFEALSARYPEAAKRVRGAFLRTLWNDRFFEPGFRQQPYPVLALDAMRYLLAQGLRYLALDFEITFGPGEAHDVWLVEPEEPHFLVEGLWRLGEIRTPLAGLLLCPLKLVGREGAPARVYAVEMSAAPAGV